MSVSKELYESIMNLVELSNMKSGDYSIDENELADINHWPEDLDELWSSDDWTDDWFVDDH